MKRKIFTLLIAPLLIALSVGLSALAANTTSQMPTILEFTSPMCPSCNQLKLVLPAVESKYANKINIQKINTASGDSQTQQLMSKYGIRVVPTLIYLDRNGNYVRSTQGALSESQLDSYFNELISK